MNLKKIKKIDYKKIMFTQNNLVMVTSSAKHRGSQIYE
jgi:ribosomal protein L14